MQVRRRLFSTGLTVAVTAAVTAALTTSVSANATPATPSGPAAGATTSARSHLDPTTATLRQLAQHTALRIGTAVDMTRWQRRDLRRMVGEQFSTVTPENVMKWQVVEPTPGSYDCRGGRHARRVRARRTTSWCAATPSSGTTSCPTG